jgi:hypothetical protein
VSGTLTWTCHVCGDERPDEQISVHKTQVELRGAVTVTQNVRYCNDRPACAEGAKTYSFFDPGHFTLERS